MGAHDRGVDQMRRIRRAGGQRLEIARPHAGLRPSSVAVVKRHHSGVVALRQVAPRRAGARRPENPVQRPPVVLPRHPAQLVRRQRRDHRPPLAGQVKTSDPQAPTVWKLESQITAKRNPLCEYRTQTKGLRALDKGSLISLPAKRDGSRAAPAALRPVQPSVCPGPAICRRGPKYQNLQGACEGR